jgi:HAD superfamily hydrolase (TIGR01490 family)
MPNSTDQPTTPRPLLIAAVFDVDRTLVPVTTTERLFIRYLLRTRVIGWSVTVKTALFVLRSIARQRVTPFEAIRRQRAYLRGLSFSEMKQEAQKCFDSEIKPRLSLAGLDAIKEHKAQGHMIVLLSGSLDFLLEPLKKYVGADHLIAARMEVVNGKLTGRIVGNFPYGSYKAAFIQHFSEEHGLDFSQSYAYADHHTDHALLSLFGNPVVINPKPKMLEIARREGWVVKEFK